MSPEMPNPKRLLALLPWFDVGGAEKFALDLFAQLSQRGWTITAASNQPSPDRWLDQFRRVTDELHLMHGAVARADQPAFIRDLIRARRPDVVLVSQTRFGFLLLPYLRLTCPGPVYADYCHIEEEWGGGGYPRMAAELDWLFDLHMVTSQHLKRWMIERGADAARTEVCTVNIDPNLWKPDAETRRRVRETHQIADDEPVILFTGRLMPQKQPRVLAGALNQCVRRGLRFRAWIAGDGEEREWLEDFLRRNEMTDRVKVLGMLGSDQVREHLAASDIFFLPSRWEGIALSIFEAMSMQVAVLGADVGGQSELVTPECGILIKPADDQVGSYAQKLGWLIEHPDERRAMAARGRQRMTQNFTLEQMGERIDSLLREIPSRARRFEPDDGAAARFADCAVHAFSDSVPLDFWRIDLPDDFMRADPTGMAARFRAYLERMTMERLESMPTWRLYQKIAPWTCRGWVRLAPAERIARFRSSLIRRLLKKKTRG